MNQETEAQAVIEDARAVAGALYGGEIVAHRSCGVAVAETFGCNIRPYSILRRGGLDGEQTCGAIRAGEMVLAELLGTDDPTAPVSDDLKAAIEQYRALCQARLESGESGLYICNELTGVFSDFQVPPRKKFCTTMAAEVAAIVAEVASGLGTTPAVVPLPEQ